MIINNVQPPPKNKDTKNHPFITDSVSAELFQRASAMIDQKDWAAKLVRERAGLTPRKIAEQIAQAAMRAAARGDRVSQPMPATQQQPSRGDLPAWAAEVLSSVPLVGSKINSKAQMLELCYPTTAPQVETEAAIVFRTQGREAAIKFQLADIAQKEGIAPGTPAYAQLEEDMKEHDPTPPPEPAEFQQILNARVASKQGLRKKAEQVFFAKDLESNLNAEAQDVQDRYAGEHGTARRAINGFLLSNPSPSPQEKLHFMKTVRDAIRASRKANGIVARALFPTLNLPAENNASDEVLLKKFDSYAATL